MNNAYAIILDMGIKVFSQLYSHNISVTHVIFLETCSCYREPSKTKVPAVFLVITTSLTSIISCNHFA